MKKMLALSVFLIGFFLIFPAAEAEGPAPGVQNRENSAPWTGIWTIFDTHTLSLNQDEDRISGSYTVLGGIVQGVILGNIAVGGFKNSDGTGWFRWTLAPDGRSFKGIYSWQGKEYPWEGSRKDDLPAKTGDSIEGTYIDPDPHKIWVITKLADGQYQAKIQNAPPGGYVFNTLVGGYSNGHWEGKITQTDGTFDGWEDARFRLDFSADRRTITGAFTFWNNWAKYNYPLAATKADGGAENPPPGPQSDQWFKNQKLIWVSEPTNGVPAAFIQELMEKYPQWKGKYLPLSLKSSSGMTNMLMLMSSAILGNRKINVKMDQGGYIVAVAMIGDQEIPLPPDKNIDDYMATLPFTEKPLDGQIKSVYTSAESETACIYIDIVSPNVQGWVKLQSPSSWITSNMFLLCCQAAALGHPVRFYTDGKTIGNCYLGIK